MATKDPKKLAAEFKALSAEVDSGPGREAAERPFQQEVAEAAKEHRSELARSREVARNQVVRRKQPIR